MRAAAFAGVFLLLINPYRLSEEPDPEGFHVAVLVDASGSMEQRDVRGGELSRLDLIQRWLDEEEPSPISALTRQEYSLQTYVFAEETLPYAGGPLQPLPGGTAIGDALLHAVRDPARQPAAVLLLSDGHSNAGASPMEAARTLQQRGVPVTAIGIGSLRPPGEISARFARSRFQGEQHSPLRLPLVLSNTRSTGAHVDLELHDRYDAVVAQKSVTIPAGADSFEEDFTVIPERSGGEGYRLVMRKEGEPDQTDIAAVEVSEPEVFRVLYLSARPAPELRFLQQATREAEQIGIETIVRTGPEMFLHKLAKRIDESIPPNAFPDEASFYNEYDAILIDAPSISDLNTDGEIFKEFVARRGGGILFIGQPPDELLEAYRTLLPIAEWERIHPSSRQPLYLETAPVFSEIAGGSLFQAPRLFLPDNAPVTVAREPKLGARLLAEVANGAGPVVMNAHAYGAGRVAWLGIDNSWQWRMATENGMRQHELFWNNLIVWLASNRKPRLNFPSHGQRFPLAADIDLGGDVMGADFRPATDARIQATITSPGNETQQVDLTPSFRQAGRYEAEWQPRETGEYRVAYTIEFPDGERIEEQSFFVVSHHGLEQQSTAYREELLRDITRVTGGQFFHYSEARRLNLPPLSDEVPTKPQRHYLAGHWLFFLVIAAALCGEWYFRRKIGLR